MTEQRFHERRRRDRRKRLLRWTGGLGAVVLVGVLVWLVWFSHVLGVRDVEVEGTRTLGVKQVRSVADVRLGTPLARLDTAAVEARVAGLPAVERVEVRRSWPRTVRVEVTERTAVAWTRVDGDVRALDRFGIDYRTLRQPPRGLVEVSTSATDPRQRQLAVVAAAAVVARLEKADPDLVEAVRAVEAPSRDAVTLRLSRDRTVTWGSAAKPKQKLKVLRALLRIRARGYDVSAPEQPTTRQ